MLYLTTAELVHVAQRALGFPPEIRDVGLLESAAARPEASAFGRDAYPALADKAAALIHSLARNHALRDGNKRLALAGLLAFLGVNGHQLILRQEEAYDLIVEIACGALDDSAAIAARLASCVEPRS